MTNSIHIDDLAAPQLNDLQQSIHDYGRTLNVELDAAAILDEASEALALNDFGDPDFRTRLDLLCAEWGADTGLNNLGRLSLRNKLLLYARSRLLIQDVLNKHPEIHDIQIKQPIIVAGLPRSGTTHLLNLMAADSRLRSLPLWESYEPVPVPGEQPLPDGTDPRYQRCADAWAVTEQTVPHLAAMHPMDPDHIHEELELMGPDFASYNFEWLCHSPQWRDHYYRSDQTPHYEYMKTVLKILAWQDGDDGSHTRWVLKCPQHLEQLPVLQAVFPDATIAVTHRDPVSVIQSAVTMLAYGQRMSRESIDPPAILDYWADRVEHLLRACMRDRPALDPQRSIDVLFHEFMADDLGMVEAIYARAGLPMTEQAKAELQAFIEAHPRGKHGKVVYDLAGQFGVTPAALRERFDFYFEQFPIQVEAGE
ncbi:sulfotransferase family protein [Halioglobus japonicus]|uniref:Sulfotransferase n=1 Tax=Halioglobus japonicus TaxID=930805 RepID=A0AAP8SPV8_9GAMM|nr:sulfotransferase [Halioglobus japonicus]AQA18994.1 sulfotransferase family protein [Halioglobus japonicus]PLW87991.1 sulfotransferase [Halioglobus japonicus]GHD20370.1 putative sulfotransferase [Halioglobus japonicus]